MKRNARILSIIVSIALVICGFVFSSLVSSAADTEYDSGFTYTVTETVDGVATDVVKNEPSSLATILGEVKPDTTITMNADVTYDVGTEHGANKIGRVNWARRNLTLDLGGPPLQLFSALRTR